MRVYLRVAALVAAVGAGVLLAGAAEAASGPCNAEPTDMSVGYGDLISCDITPATDVDLYRFTGHAGDRILVEAAFVNGALFLPRIELFAPDGTSLGVASTPPRLDEVLPQSGTYTVRVFNHYITNATSGEYTVMVSCTGGTCVIPPPPPANPPVQNIACEPEPTDQFPGYGTRVSCDITPATDVDVYRFAGAAGDRVLAEAAYVSGDLFIPRIQMFAPDGTSLQVASTPPRLDVVLPQAGTYTVIVFNHFVTNATAGQYTFMVSCTGGSCLPPPGKLPAVTLTLTGCTTCRPGNTFSVQAHLTNPASKTIQAELKFGLRLPDGTPINTIGNKHLEIPFPAGLNTNATLLTFPWPSGLPQGTWTVEATLLGPDLGDTSSRATQTFASAP
ncbi:MAG TPA: PPC domain-containing protein [Vicinamibacterales bacterium]|jgi:hypothetical protein